MNGSEEEGRIRDSRRGIGREREVLEIRHGGSDEGVARIRPMVDVESLRASISGINRGRRYGTDG